jgi:site-specific DNA-methyltransferase (adenine-specific)
MQNNYNPDVLSCLASLSNDEVFTPPELVNDMLDLLPAELWRNPQATFLDPVTKSGVFLREIAKRLMLGLEQKIPDRQERINHIFTKQLFGIALTELTALLSRRSIYCSKYANSDFSVCTEFDGPDGNIYYQRMQHSWQSGKCVYCGASQEVHDRGNESETYAYNFIHTDDPRKFFDMKFDVIVGNPPYQINDGGAGVSSSPLYHEFVEQAKKIQPKYLLMIIPSRWFSGGKGLDKFREKMLSDVRIKIIVDYFNSNECFPGVDISGGICYFLWDKNYTGDCEVTTVRNGQKTVLKRPLLEKNSRTFIRFNEAISIVRKIQKENEISFDSIVSSRKPFGIATNVKVTQIMGNSSVEILAYPKNGYVDKHEIVKNKEWIDKYKILMAKAYGERGDFPYLVLPKPFIVLPGTCCSETYLVVGPFDDKYIAENVVSYILTKFFRFCVLLKKNTQDATKQVYSVVPIQDFAEAWTDEKLYKKYGLSEHEIAFIESMIRPMELSEVERDDEEA